jgi:hypothetical protein
MTSASQFFDVHERQVWRTLLTREKQTCLYLHKQPQPKRKCMTLHKSILLPGFTAVVTLNRCLIIFLSYCFVPAFLLQLTTFMFVAAYGPIWSAVDITDVTLQRGSHLAHVLLVLK